MTAFVKDGFYGSEYVDYNFDGKSKFVARFKYAKGCKTSFINFLIKNFTVEEYFSRLEANETPLKILESKGYLQPHVKKMLKSLGYPATVAARDMLIADQIAARKV